MRPGVSISLRLTSWFSAIFLCEFVAFGLFIWFDLGASLSSGRDKTLGRRAERMADLLENAQDDSLADLHEKYYEFVEATPEGRLIQVYAPDGERLLPAVGSSAVEFPWPKLPPQKDEYRCDVWFKGQPNRVYVRQAILNGKPVRIFVAGQLTDNHALLNRLKEILERLTPVVLLVSALAGYFISRRALRPVVRLTNSVRSISIGNLEARLPVLQNDDELARLAVTCNEMLSRLEGAVKRITQFTADASHELRSPISLIRTTCDYALSTPNLDTEAAQAFTNIVDEATRCTSLLDDMLLLARYDSGQTQLAYEPVYMGELVQEVLARMSVMAKKKQQHLVKIVTDEEVQFPGDALMLRRLILILVDNAIKYTHCGGRIEVAFFRKAQQGILTVSDNGIGIPADALPHIFDRFFRVDPSRAEQDGTGLGLAIAKWIAEAHRAQISARSNELAGSTFEVIFPLNETEKQRSMSPGNDATSGRTIVANSDFI